MSLKFHFDNDSNCLKGKQLSMDTFSRKDFRKYL